MTMIKKKLRRSIAFLLALALMLSGISTGALRVEAQDSNLVRNGDFEEVDKSGEGLFAWVGNSIGESNGTIAQKMEGGHDGAYAEITAETTYALQTSGDYLIPVTPNSIYDFSYWVELVGEVPSLIPYVYYYKDNGGVLSSAGFSQLSGSVEGKATWKKVDAQIVIPDNVVEIGIQFVLSAGTEDKGDVLAKLDDVMLQKTDESTEILNANNVMETRTAYSAEQVDLYNAMRSNTETNLLSNGSFENGTETWSLSASGNAVCELTEKETYDGEKSLKIEVLDASGEGYVSSTPVEVEAGQVYTISYAIKVETGAQAIPLVFEFDENLNVVNAGKEVQASYGKYAASGWETVSFQYTVSENTKLLRLDFLHNAVAGNSYWDDFSIVKVVDDETGDGTDSSINGDFEAGKANWNILPIGAGASGNVVDSGDEKHGKVLKTELAATEEHAQIYVEGAQISAKPNYIYTISYDINVDILEKTSIYQYGAITLIQEFQPNGMPGVVQPFAEHAIGSDTNGWEKVTYEYRTSADCDSLRIDLMYANIGGVALWDNVSIVEKGPYAPKILDAKYDHGGTEETASPDNLISNSTFDEGNNLGWGKQSGVDVYQTENENGGVAQITVSPGVYFQSTSQINVESKSFYRLTYYVKVENAKNLDFIPYIFYNSGENWKDFLEYSVSENTNGNWKKVEITFETPTVSKDTTVTIGFVALHTQECNVSKGGTCNCTSSGTVYLDDISLVKVTNQESEDPNEPSQTGFNGDFEAGNTNWNIIPAGTGASGKVVNSKDKKHGKVLKTELEATKEHAQVYVEGPQIPAKANYIYTISYDINVDILEKVSTYQYGALTLIQEFQSNGTPGVVQPFIEHAINSDTKGWKKITYEYRTSAECASLRIDLMYANIGGVALWDNVSIVEKSPYAPTVLDAKYDHGGTKDTASKDNVITNSTFDNGSNLGWGKQSGVEVYQTKNKNGGVAQITVSPGVYFQSADSIKVKSKSFYKLTYYVKVEKAKNLNFTSYIFYNDGENWKDFLDYGVSENTKGSWKKIEITFETPKVSKDTTVTIGFVALHTEQCNVSKGKGSCNCKSSGTVYLDDISLVKVTKEEALNTPTQTTFNGDFEAGNTNWNIISAGTGASGKVVDSKDKKHGKVLKTELKATEDHAQVYVEGAQIPAKANYIYTISYEINVDILEKVSTYQYGALALIQEFQADGTPGVVQPFTEYAIGSDTKGWKKVIFEYRTSAECDSLRIDLMYANIGGTALWDNVSIVAKKAYVPKVLDAKYDHGGTKDTASKDNVITNSTFDNGSNLGWGKQSGVEVYQTKNKNGGVAQITASSGVYFQSASPIKVESKSLYRLTYYVKVEKAKNLDFTSYIFYNDGENWKDFLNYSVSENTKGKWKKVEVTFATPEVSKKTTVTVGFVALHTQQCDVSKGMGTCNCTSSGIVYLDDISLIREGAFEDVGEGRVSEDSIVYNGSFDRYATDPYTVDGWDLNKANKNHNTVIQDKVAKSGNAIRIDATGHSYIWAAGFSADPGTIYILSFWVRVDKAKGLKFAAYMNDASNDGSWWVNDAAPPLYDVTDGWIKIQSAITVPESVGNNPKNPKNIIQLGFEVCEGAGLIYLDDVSLVPTKVDSNNLNLDFELDSNILYNWSLESYNGGNGVMSASTKVRPGSKGKVSALVNNAGTSGETIFISKAMKVKPNTTYEFAYWTKQEGTYAALTSMAFRQLKKDGMTEAYSMRWDGNASAMIKAATISPYWTYQVQGEVGWRQVRFSVTTGQDTHYLDIRFVVTGSNTKTWIDDVSFKKVTNNKNFDFEYTSADTGAPENWYMSLARNQEVTFKSDSKVYHSGRKSLYIKKDSLMEKTLVESSVYFPVNSENIYEFSAWVTARNASPDCSIRMNLYLYNQKGERLYTKEGSFDLIYGTLTQLNSGKELGDWKKMVTRSAPPAEAAYASVTFTVTRGTAEIWIDDLFVDVVEDGTDCVVDYTDFHAVDHTGKIAGWELETVSGNAKFTKASGGHLTIEQNSEAYIKHPLDCLATDYTYCIKGNYQSDIGGTAELRFYDYKGEEYKDYRQKTAILAGGNVFELNFTAPSASFVALYIGSDQAGTMTIQNVTTYMLAKPADSADWDGFWAWYPENPVSDAVEQYRYFRYTFVLEDDAEYAPLQLTVDDKYALYVNGELIAENWDAGSDSWANVADYDLTDKVKQGENVIALKCFNLVSEAGVLFDGKFTLKNQSTHIVASGMEMKSAKTADDVSLNWTKVGFNDSSWVNCIEYGQPPCSPWGPVFYKSSLYMHNAAEVVSVDVPESITSGNMLNFKMTLLLESAIEANFSPMVTIYKRNSLTSVTSTPLTLNTYENPMEWPVGEKFEVECSITVPDYVETGKYELKMDENMLLLSGADVFDNKFLSFKAKANSTGRDPIVSSIEEYNGTPTLLIDGEPHGSIFYLRPDLNVYLQTDAETRMYKSDFELYITYGGQLYKGGCDPIWLEDGTIDFDAFDKTIYDTLGSNSNALAMVNIGMFAPTWWMEENPEHVVTSHNGSQYLEQDDASFASEKFRHEAGEVLRQLIQHMKEQGYWNRIYGLKITGGHTYEWMTWGTGPTYGPDYSKISQEGFKKYLEKTYGTVAELRKAWGNSSVTFDTATAPGWNERGDFDNVYMAKDGKLARWMVDWNLYLNDAAADTFLYYCQIAKEETDNQLIVGGYYGYLWTNHSYEGQGKAHTATQRVMNSEYVDWIASPIAYAERTLGESDQYMAMVDGVQEYGKLYIAEQDNRTCLSSVYAGASWDADWDFQVGQTRTLADTVYQEKRDYANAMVNGHGLWLYDMTGGWLDDDQIYDFMSDAKAEYDFNVYVEREQRSDIAVFVGDECAAYMTADDVSNMPYTLYEPLLMQQRKHLAAIGTGYDTYSMSALLDGKVTNHKVNLILSPYEITTEMERAIEKYLKRDGQIVVWVYLPGISEGTRLNLSNVEDVTGFKIGLEERKAGLQVKITNGSHDLTKGMEGQVYGSSQPSATSPITYIADTSGATVLGYNLDGNQPGLAIKDMGDWTSVYSAAPCIDVQMLRNLLTMADSHIYSENNEDVIYANNHYVALHSAEGGTKTISLPEKHSVYDVFAEEFVSMDTDTITYEHDAKDTKLYRLMTSNHYAVTARLKAGKGTLSAPGLTEVAAGESYTLTVTPEEGYEVASVTVNGEVVELKDDTFQVDEVNENHVIHVRFSKMPELVEVVEIIEEWIILPWPVFIAGVAVLTIGIYWLKKKAKEKKRKKELQEGGMNYE